MIGRVQSQVWRVVPLMKGTVLSRVGQRGVAQSRSPPHPIISSNRCRDAVQQHKGLDFNLILPTSSERWYSSSSSPSPSTGDKENATPASEENGNGEEVVAEEDVEKEGIVASAAVAAKGAGPGGVGKERIRLRGYDKDRTKVIPVEVSMKYLRSEAYKETYKGNLVWVLYRRNFKGQFAPKKTRKTCIRHGVLSTGNPCPICRDEYLVLDYRNVDLLKQFISPFNGEILNYSRTGLCQVQHEQLVVEILKAKDYGTITFDVPLRQYDYSEYQHLYESYKAAS